MVRDGIPLPETHQRLYPLEKSRGKIMILSPFFSKVLIYSHKITIETIL
jgi:hypothetical protein